MNNCNFDDSGFKPCEEQAIDCESCEYNEDFVDEFPDDSKFRLTEPYLLFLTLQEYGIVKEGTWNPKIWGHLFEDFMESLVKAGYVEKATNNDFETKLP